MVELIGLVFTIFTIFVWAFASLVYKKGLEKTQPKANLFFRLCCTSIGTLVFSLILGNYIFLTNLTNTELIVYLIACFISGLSVTIGDLLYYMSLTKIDASRTYPLVQLSLVFVIFFSVIFFGEEITVPILLGAGLIVSSVFILSSKDKSEKLDDKKRTLKERISEDIIIGVLLAISTAFFWALAYVSLNQARILTGDVFVSNFFRVVIGMAAIALLGIFKREYYSGFKKENRKNLKYFIYIGIAGILSLGFADAIYIKASEINELVLTSALAVNTPMVQQILSILILKEKFRKRFIIAVILIIVGNYIILFL